MPADPEYVLKKALELGAQDAVINSETVSRVQVKFVNNQVAVSQGWSEDKLDIFLAVNRRLVSTSITPQSRRGMDRVLKKLLSQARVTAPKKGYMGIAEGPFRYRKVKGMYDRDAAALDNPTALVKETLQASWDEGAERVTGILETNLYSRSILTSSSAAATEKGTTLLLSIRAFAGRGSGHAVACSRKLSTFKPGKAGQRAGEVAQLARRWKPGKKGRYRALFDPLAFAPMVEVTGEAASIFAVEAGFSYLGDELGRMIGNEKVTLYDDGRLENGLLSRGFDEEGVPTQQNLILQEGVLMGHLHNTSTARRCGTETTANAGLISPRPWNLVLQHGTGKKEEGLEELGDGIYITNTWYTRFQNYSTGDFSTVPRDGIFLVQGGEIKGSIGGIRVSDSLPRIFKNVAWASRESQQIRSWEVAGSVTSPWVIVDGVQVTRATR